METKVNRRITAVRLISFLSIVLVLIVICLGGWYWWSQSHEAGLEQGSKTFESEVPQILGADDKYNQQGETISKDMEKIKIAFTGDQGNTIETKKALRVIREESAEALVLLGDFDYQDGPAVWVKNLDEYLGKYFPVLAVAGNHEETIWTEYAKVVQDKISQLPKDICTADTKADIGLTYNCMLGPVHIVLTTPDINIKQSIARSPLLYIRDAFRKELASKVFIQEPMADGEEDDPPAMPSKGEAKDPWRICAWHKVHPLMQLGTKNDNISWDIYEECRRFGAYIVNGHDHVYARSKTVLDFPGMIVDVQSLREVVVRPNSTGVAILGLGGMSIRPHERKGDTWWANTYSIEKLKIEAGVEKTNTAGIMFCTFDKNEDTAPCYFKTIDGVVRDEFVMKR